MKKFDKYDRMFHGHKLDVYDVIKIFNVTDPALQHLLKKVLCAGNRGHKNTLEDLENIVASGTRAIEIYLAETNGVYANIAPAKTQITIGPDGRYDINDLFNNDNIYSSPTGTKHVYRFFEKSSERIWYDFEYESALFSGRAYTTEEDAKQVLDAYIKRLEKSEKDKMSPAPIMPITHSLKGKGKDRTI